MSLLQRDLFDDRTIYRREGKRQELLVIYDVRVQCKAGRGWRWRPMTSYQAPDRDEAWFLDHYRRQLGPEMVRAVEIVRK